MALPALALSAGRLLATQGVKSAASSAAKSAVKNAIKNKIKNSNKLLSEKSPESPPPPPKNSSLIPLSGEKTGALAIRPITSIVPTKSLDDTQGKKSEESKKSLLDSILSELISIKKIISSLKKSIDLKSAADKKATKDAKNALNKEKREKREGELESKKKKNGIEGLKLPSPKFSFFDFILKFLGNILLGGLIKLLLNNRKPIFGAIDTGIKNWRLITRALLDKKFRKPFLKLLGFTAKALLNPLYLPGKLLGATIDSTGKVIRKTFSAIGNGIKIGINSAFRMASRIINAAKSSANFARRAARAFTGALRGGRGIRGAAQAVGTAAQRSRRQATTPKSKPKVKPPKAGSAARNLGRVAKGARAVRAIRIPVIGPLLAAVDSWLSGDPPSQTLFKTAGSAIGGMLGNFIPIPILGMILGEYIGEYVGNLFYYGLKSPGGWKKAGDILWNDLKKAFDTGKRVMDWLGRGTSRYINNWPKLRIPNMKIPGPIRAALEVATLWKAGKFEGVHDLLGKFPLSPFKFISDKGWFGNKKGKFSHLPDPTFMVRDPIAFLKHVKNSFLGTSDVKPKYTPPDMGDMSLPNSQGSGRTSTGSPSTTPSSTSPSSQAGGAISNKSAEQIVSSMGFSIEDWNLYKNTVAQIESGGDYTAKGGSGGRYDGRYQMGEAAKKDGSKYAGIPNPGHSPSDRAAFRSNPVMQEVLFAGYTKANYAFLMGNPKFRDASPERKLQILGYAHNQGMGGANDWLNTGRVGVDGFLTKGTRYTDAIAAEFKKRGKSKSSQQQTAQLTPPPAPVLPPPPDYAKSKEITETEEMNRKDKDKIDLKQPQTIPSSNISSSSPQVNFNSLGQQAPYEISGGQIIPIPIPLPARSQQQTLPSRGGVIPIGGISSGDLLNSYYRSQLLGFLYKQG